MYASRNKDDKEFKKNFDNWRKEAQAKIKLYKKEQISHEELFQWIMKNK